MIPEDRSTLLQKIKTMVELERCLTATLEHVEPWLLQNSKRQLPNQPRVRPIPTTMEEVEQILAVARVLANRTSAPVGWNPTAPVVGFSTPNPMPHQLRGGALAALQLDRARQTERLKKRQRKQEEALNKVGRQVLPLEENKEPQQHEEVTEERIKKEPPTHQQQQQQQTTQPRASSVTTTTSAKPPVDVSMNLSDSSSSSSDEEEDE